MTKPAYDTSYFPPAPIVPIAIVALPHGTQSSEVQAFVDTGADATIVPRRLLHSIHARPIEFVQVRSYIGERRSVRTYAVDLIVGGVTLPGLEIIGDDVTETLVGRDVLNRLRLVLDGPRQTIEVGA